MILSIFIAVVIVSSIGAALAGLLVISEYFFANYGKCKITVNDQREITVDGGNSLLSVLVDDKIFIPSACGGRGTCGLCKLKAIEGAGALLPTEEPYLDTEERELNVRLSCQVKVRNDLKIEIPPELFAIREYTCKCVDIVDLTYDIKRFRLELLDAEIDYIPGQYVQLLTPVYQGSDEEVYRAYSIASDPNQKNIIDLIIRLVPNGICTTYCFNYLKVEDQIKINGPYGDFRLSDTDAPIAFIAGGSGMAPVRCILHHMKNTANNRKAIYYFGANKIKELFLVDEMKMFEAQLNDFQFAPVIATPEEEENWSGQRGLVTEAVQQNLKNASQYEAYLCGSPGMIDASIKVLLGLGMSEEKIFYDKFE